MKKRVFVLCLAICLLFAVSSVCAGDVNDTAIASDNANQVIEEVNDEVIFESEEINEGEISSENEDILNAQDNGTFTALQTKINNAAEDSTITLENDYSYNDGFNVNGITLSKSLTIDGKGKTIDAKGQARIFNIEPDTNIILKNLILKNAYTEGDGGVIYAYKVNLTVTDSIFTDNLAQSGGAIYANESNVILSHDKFLKNQAMLAGGSIIARRTNVDISNTLFEGNYAGGGGSLQILANGRKDVTAKFENNIFKNSTATYTAGFFYTSNPTTVINCTFENYDGNEYGGLVADNNLKLISSRFKNSYNVLGGAVGFNSGEYLNVINCIFENNHAQHGGAIYSNGHLTISGSHFVNNSAEYNGGAIYADNIVSSVFDGDFTGNTADCGGAVYGNIEKTTFNGDFIENTANTGGAIYGNITDSIFNGDFTENIAYAGGAIYGNITDSIFNGNLIHNIAYLSSLEMDDVLGACENDLLSFVPAMSGVGGGICGNVVGTTLNTNFVMNTADVGAVIAGNVEKSVCTGKISQNYATEGIIVSGNTVKSIFSGDIDDILEIDSNLFGDWLDSFIKKFLNEKEREQLENLTKKIEIEVEADLNIYVDSASTLKPDEISVLYHFNVLNFLLDKTVKYSVSELKKVMNPLDGPLGNIADSFLDELLSNITETLMGDRTTAYLTIEIKTFNNLKDATQIANVLGLIYKEKYFKLNKEFSLNDLSVKIAPGVYRGDKNKGLEIKTNYTLMKDGEGDVIIDAENNGNILTVKWRAINIDGLTFMHASDSAIIFEVGLSDSVINANFIENYLIDNIDHVDNPIPLKHGGSAINFNGDIKHSTITGIFQNNYAKEVYSGTISAVGHNIEDCIFNGIYINNTGVYTNGALLWCDKIINSIFSGNFIENKAYDNPGIIWANTIDGSTFSGNFINNLGKGLYFPQLIKCNTILDSKFNGYFSNNYFQSGVIGAGEFSNCIFDGVFKNNSVMIESAYWWGIIDASDTILKSIFNGTFIDNEAHTVINVHSEELIDCDFSGNFKYNTYTSNGTTYRSYVYHSWRQNDFILACSDNIISSSELDNILIVPSNEIYVDGSAASNGDGSSYNPFNNLKSAINIANEGDTVYIYPGTYAGENNVGLTINKSLNLIKIGNDEVIFDAQNNGRIFTVDTTSLNIVGLTFTNATDSAITFSTDIVSSIIEANFVNNRNKAALYVTGRAINSLFIGDYIKNTANGGGAAIHADSFLLCELNANFINNAAANGGAIAGNIISSTINGTFADNTAVNGAAIAGNIMKSVVNAKFTNNTASGNGGAIYGNVSSSNFTSNFINNNAVNGGVIYGSVSSCNFCSDFIDNRAANGGVICGSVSSSAFNCNFMNNDAGKGGVVYCSDVSKSVFKGEFSDNGVSADYGKILYSEDVILDCKFIGEIFVSNMENLTDRVYSNTDNVFNCIFTNPRPIDEKDMSVPALPNSAGKSVTVTLPGDAKGTITLNIGGKSYNFDVIGGVANVKVPDLANGAYPYSITYSGDDKYAPFTKTGSLTINNSPQNTKPTNTKTSTSKKTTKTTLTLKKVKVKKSAKKLVISATLKINGKAVKGKIIKFKFNKKTYKAKTNKKGVAKITIKKAVLKKLKAGKKVTYTATYGKTTKKVIVKVKK